MSTSNSKKTTVVDLGAVTNEELLAEIVKRMVAEPKAVEIRVVGSEKTSILSLKVAPGDYGAVIGKGGAHIRALQTLVTAFRVEKRIVELNLIDVPPKAKSK